MSRFYGILRNPGSSKVSTRCGHSTWGLLAEARTWTQMLQIELRVVDGKDWITLWYGSPYGKMDWAWRDILWEGPMDSMPAAFAKAFPQQEEVQEVVIRRTQPLLPAPDADPMTGTAYGDLT